MRLNTHTHSAFSPDGSDSVFDLCKKASELGMGYIAITDHCDIDYFDPRFALVPDFASCFAQIERARQAFPDLIIASGVELGFTATAKAKNQRLVDSFPFDYVINSVHQVDLMECYYQTFFDNKTKEQGYERYFATVLDSLDVCYRFDAVGHLGYVCRNAPFADRTLIIPQTQALIDQILKKIIEQDKIIELNTSVCTAPYPFLPSPEILARYHQLGGRLITFASDAHRSGDLLRGWEAAMTTARAIGFDSLVFVKDGKRHSAAIS